MPDTSDGSVSPDQLGAWVALELQRDAAVVTDTHSN